MNIAGVELFDLRPSGGADNVVVNDLAGAGLGQLIADLANDGAADVVEIKVRRLQTSSASTAASRSAASVRRSTSSGTGRERQAEPRCRCGQRSRCRRGRRKRHDRRGSVNCCPQRRSRRRARRAADRRGKREALAVESLAGNDTLNAGLGLAALTQLTLDGGAGNDAINGGDGNDTLRGEAKTTRSTETEAPTWR